MTIRRYLMTYLSQMKVGKHTYIYEVSDFKNVNGNRNKKHPVGKIDPLLDRSVFKSPKEH
jgi:hypothetical protein